MDGNRNIQWVLYPLSEVLQKLSSLKVNDLIVISEGETISLSLFVGIYIVPVPVLHTHLHHVLP